MITTLSPKSIASLGKDEYWLQDYICENPSVLGLGDVVVVYRERKQISRGRLDILLRSVDEEDFFEVEVMMGETDPSHIIRTIEYWDLEKRKWPKRRHTAVLVAEKINTRFYNVINLLSLSVPIIGIQVNAYGKDGNDFSLVFNKVIDSYQEPETDYAGDDASQVIPVGDANPNLVEIGKCLVMEFNKLNCKISMNPAKFWIGLFVDGSRVCQIFKRGNGKATVEFSIDPSLSEPLTLALKDSDLNYDFKPERIRFWIDAKDIAQATEITERIGPLISKYYSDM